MSICKVYIVLALALVAASCKASSKVWVVGTLAGSGPPSFADGAGSSALFNDPTGMAVDSRNGNVYVADTHNHCIRKVTADGTVSTLAGSGAAGFADGSGSSAQFDHPKGVVVDSRNGSVYVADSYNHCIRKVTADGVVSTLAGSGAAGFADGAGSEAQFNFPYGVAVNSSGNVYVADRDNGRIRKVTADGVVSTLAGSGAAGIADGPGSEAQFNQPAGVAVDSSGNVYVADESNHCIRKVAADGVVSTLAGSGTLDFTNDAESLAKFNLPAGVAVDSRNGNVYVADISNHCIRKVTADGAVSNLAGSGTAGFADGAGSEAQFNYPSGVAVDSSGNVYVADRDNNRIRKIEYRMP